MNDIKYCHVCDAVLTVDGMCSGCEEEPKDCICPSDDDMGEEIKDGTT